MSGERHLETVQVRLIKAITVVLAIVLVIPGASVVATYLHASLVKAEVPVGIDSAYILSANDAFAALDRLEEELATDEVKLPDWAGADVSVLPDARVMRVGADGAVVGYVVDGDAESAYGRIADDMQEKGWTAIPLAGEVGATFIREEGRYTWVLVTCTQAGEATSVVTRCASA